MDYLITGGTGQLGRAVLRACARRGRDCVGLAHKDLAVEDKKAVERVIGETKPRFVLHCGAWTDVDGCEKDRGKAMACNAEGTVNVALACKKHDTGLVYVSTDFVFDGAKTTPYSVLDATNPISVYGESKRAGEQAVLAHGAERFYVLRTSWVFGPGGKNFPLAIVNRAKSGQPMSVVDDEIGCPSLTNDIAEAMLDLCEQGGAPGVWHASNEGVTTRWNFAVDILREAGLGHIEIKKVAASSLVRPAKRPAYSALDCGRLWLLRNRPMPHYLDALKRYLKEEFS